MTHHVPPELWMGHKDHRGSEYEEVRMRAIDKWNERRMTAETVGEVWMKATVSVIGNCGKTHASFEEWRHCKACRRHEAAFERNRLR